MLDHSVAPNARSSRRLDEVFRALAHPVRREILSRIGSGERTISELAEPFDMTLEAVSQHVRVLERARLLRRRRRGREHHCRIDPTRLREAGAMLVKLAGFWEGQLASLDRWLATAPEKE
ncbi:MAG TPA: metalloregulator ArsR/SmtB family transcription factor [Polyangia bacterium]|nr:metalloregulator ArsR/SmtB family transcription factor [Polyangia bacterium]